MAIYRPRYNRPGTAPGTLTERADAPGAAAIVRRIRYSPDHYEEDQPTEADQALAGREGWITWIDVVGLSDVPLIRGLGERLGLHPLALEDVFNAWQRPKLESFDDYLFLIFKLPHARAALEADQTSIFVGPDWVVTVQESEGEVFEPVRARIRQGGGRIRRTGSDYLAYALVDALVDNFFPLLERYGDRLESLETTLIENPDPAVLARLHEMKKDLLLIRRAAWPQREVVNALERSETPLVGREAKVFLRDCYDHAVQILDIVETYRDVANGLTDLYLTSVSNRTNEVMRVLTVMSSIFIPLTFIAGIYGMNFDPGASPLNMPELNWFWGYPFAIAMMLVVGIGMLVLFKRRGWLPRSASTRERTPKPRPGPTL